MALSLGPDFRSIATRGEWELVAALFPFSVGLETRLRGARAGRCAGGSAPGLRGGGSAAAPLPLLFGSASSQSTPPSSSRRVGGGCQPVGRGTRGSSPAPPYGAPLPPLSPEAGGGGCNARPAPPHPPRLRKPRGPPWSPGRSRPWRRPPPPHEGPRGRAGARLTVMCGMLFLPW